MTKTYFPFDAGLGANVIEAQWAKMARLFCPTGVVKNQLNQLETFADNTGMTVKVKSGQAFVEGFFFESDAQESLTISAAHATLPRIDRVVVRLDRTANTIDLAVLAGTPNASPAIPALTQNSTTWEIALARVAVAAADTSIAAGDVTDEREFTVDWTSPGVPQIVLKTADETVTSSTTLQDDDHLKFNGPPNQKIFFDLYLRINTAAGATSDFKCGWSYPAGVTMNWGLDAAGERVAGFTGAMQPASTADDGLSETETLNVGLGNVTTTFMLVHIAGWIFFGANSGTIQFRWAQNTSDVTGTVLKQDSFLKYMKIG